MSHNLIRSVVLALAAVAIVAPILIDALGAVSAALETALQTPAQ